MLELIPHEHGEYFDEEQNRFVKVRQEGVVYHFEHSLYAIALWESKYKKPFFTNKEKTAEEMIDYVSFMNLDDDFDVNTLTQEDILEIFEYMQDEPTATTISSDDNDNNSRIIMTSEVIYAYMANARIPFECDKWNIHRLMKLVAVIGEFNKPKKKMTEREILAQQHALNEKRLAELGTNG